MTKFIYTVSVEAETPRQADQVMNERLGADEDYGFDYLIWDWNRVASKPERLKPEEAGCIIDGQFGQYIPAMVVQFATNRGYLLGDRDSQTIERILREQTHPGVECVVDPNWDASEWDAVDWLANDAEAWLNENVAPEGYSFGFHDGEYFMQSDAWWEEES